MKNEVIEDKSVDGVMNFCEESLNFLLGDGEVLIDHFFEVGSFFHVGIGVHGNDVSDFLEGEYIVQSIVLLVKSNAALGLADGGFVAAGQAGPKLHNFIFMDIAQHFFIFGMSLQHTYYSFPLLL